MESTINAVRGGNTLAGPETLGAQGNTVSAEMLSPDQTVQLLANVVQKMAINQSTLTANDYPTA